MESVQGMWRGDVSAPPVAVTDLPQVRVQLEKTQFFMELVLTERSSSQDEPVQVWMSPAGELMRLSESGRIVGSSGSWYVDWRNSKTSPIPPWNDLIQRTQRGATVQYVRTRDVQPGGLIGLREVITVQRIPAPHSLPGNVLWLQEQSVLQDSSGRWARLAANDSQFLALARNLPPAQFALQQQDNGRWQWVYSRQCLAVNVCMTFTPWPAAAADNKGAHS